MARTFTLAQLVTQVRRRANIENTQRCTDTEIKAYISASYTWLYDLLINSGEPFFHSTQTITTDGSATYALSATFYRMVRVRYQASSNTWYRVRAIHPNNIDKLPVTGAWAPWYQVIGSSIELFPTPPSGKTYQVRYIPAPADLVNDADTVDGISGWEELLIIDAAIKCKRKSEEDTSELERDRMFILDRIEKAAYDRLMAEPKSLFEEDPAEEYLDPGSWLAYYR